MKGNSVVNANENQPVAPGKPKSDLSSTTPSVSAAITKGEGELASDEDIAAAMGASLEKEPPSDNVDSPRQNELDPAFVAFCEEGYANAQARAEEGWIKCPDCNGLGWSWHRFGETNKRAQCWTCEGEGEVLRANRALYVFFRESGFYPLELRDDADARANAEANPGTIRVLKMPTEEQVWPLN